MNHGCTEAVQDRPTRFSKQNLLNGSCNRVFEITAAPFPPRICYQSISLNPTSKSLDSEQVAATKKELLFPSTGEFSSAEQSGLFSVL
jgi:hypothetical protein